MDPKAREKYAKPSQANVQLEVCVGKVELPVGKLVFVKNGPRQFSQFAYEESWLRNPHTFNLSADLEPTLDYQTRKPPSSDDSSFFLALADTEPDAWGRRVTTRAHARRRKEDASLKELTELDYLCAVDDFSRIGALRLRDEKGIYLRAGGNGKHTTPPLLELEGVLGASRRVEMSQETAADLKYLQGKGTSLGGMRPKCTVLENDGTLALGKFPSVKDERSVTRGEVLALQLAQLAGIEAAQARIEMVQGSPVAIVRRFDRVGEARIPYMSAATLLQSSRNEEYAYTEIIDQMRSVCAKFNDDAQQLWRRLVFNLLITNVDDHLQNLGFIYVDKNRWRLSPAFDLNPFPDKDRESKTWLSEDTGPIDSVQQLLAQAHRFQLKPAQAKEVLGQVANAVRDWRALAASPRIGLAAHELDDFAPAFEHADLEDATRLAAT